MDAKCSGNGAPHYSYGLYTVLIIEDKAGEALSANEVPVGCVFVRNGSIIAKARNRTNELRNVITIFEWNFAAKYTSREPDMQSSRQSMRY